MTGNFLLCWVIFCPFNVLTTWKIKIEHLDIWPIFTWVPQMTIIWCMVAKKWSTTDIFFSIFDHFVPFLLSLTTHKIKILKKKRPKDIIILHMCTINGNYIMYGSWDMESDKQLSFWVISWPFTPLTTWKTKILKPFPLFLNKILWNFHY